MFTLEADAKAAQRDLAAGLGIAQTIEFGVESWMASKQLVQILAGCLKSTSLFMLITRRGLCRQLGCAPFLDFSLASFKPPFSDRRSVRRSLGKSLSMLRGFTTIGCGVRFGS
jgi:hypothetical protein